MQRLSFSLIRVTSGLVLGLGTLAASETRALAAPPTKEECVAAHGRAQDERAAGHLLMSQRLFELCNQPACPALVQADCAQFSEELSRLVPSVGFAARDQDGNDLPDTSVYVDDRLAARRLDDGRAHELDPGSHRVRFVHDGRSVTLQVVINQGEQGRTLTASFSRPASPPARVATAGAHEPKPAGASKSPLPLVLAGVGGASLVAGGVLIGVGLAKVPSNCSISSKECQAPPGDQAFDDAHSGVMLTNIGLAAAITGAIVGIGGLVLYWVSPAPEADRGVKLGSTSPGTNSVVFTF